MNVELTDTYTPASSADLVRFISENAQGERRPLYPEGGGTALNYGYPISDPGTRLILGKLANTIEYPARDMTITVEAGISIAALAAILQTERQRLPIDVARPELATLGGIVATDTSGPRRYGLGTLRDYVIGISAVDAHGTLFKAGGRVVKNVAGYDLCKLLIGSLGTLAVITQVTLKLRPQPESSGGLWVSFGSLAEIEPVLARLMTSTARPVAIEVLDRQAAAQIAAAAGIELAAQAPVLFLTVEGGERETAWQLEALAGEIAAFRPQHLQPQTSAISEKLIRALTEYASLPGQPLVFRANLPPSQTLEFASRATDAGVAVQAHAGNGIVIGRLPDNVTTAEAATRILTPLRQLARTSHGNLQILNCDAEWKQTLPVFGESESSWALMQRLKNQLDPHDLLNRGRLWHRVLDSAAH